MRKTTDYVSEMLGGNFQAHMTDQLDSLVASCLTVALSDESWRGLGYRKRPRYGTFFQRLRPQWKVRLERRLLVELIAITAALHVADGLLPSADIQRFATALAAVFGGEVQALGYDSPQDAVDALEAAVRRYSAAAPGTWHIVFFNAIKPDTIPDSALRAQLIVGVIRVATNAGLLGMVATSRKVRQR